MYVNIPERWWIIISLMFSMVAIAVLGVGVWYFQIREEPLAPTPTVGVAMQPSATPSELPQIILAPRPLRAQLGVGMPIRFEVTERITSLGQVTVLVNGNPSGWQPTILPDQQRLVTTFPWLPDVPGRTNFLIQVATTDGRVVTQAFFMDTEGTAADATQVAEVTGFRLTLAEFDNPFDIAEAYGVCPEMLLAANPGLENVDPGSIILIPTNQATSGSCEPAPENFFAHPQIGVRRVNLGGFPIDPGFGISRGYGCHSYFTGIDPSRVAGLAPCPAAEPNFHSGMDVGAPVETPVVAAAAGVIQFAGPDTLSNANCTMQGSQPPHNGYGNMIAVKASSGNFVFIYAHLSDIQVEVGQQVGEGQILGLVGSTGCSSAPHLHFEVREYRPGGGFRDSGYTWCNPETYLASKVCSTSAS